MIQGNYPITEMLKFGKELYAWIISLSNNYIFFKI
jgi:hypothetical protein